MAGCCEVDEASMRAQRAPARNDAPARSSPSTTVPVRFIPTPAPEDIATPVRRLSTGGRCPLQGTASSTQDSPRDVVVDRPALITNGDCWTRGIPCLEGEHPRGKHSPSFTIGERSRWENGLTGGPSDDRPRLASHHRGNARFASGQKFGMGSCIPMREDAHPRLEKDDKRFFRN